LELKKSSNPDLANAALLVVSELQRLHRCIWSPWGCLLVSLPLVCFLKFRIDIYRCPYYSQVWCNLARKKDVEDLFPEFYRKHHSPAPLRLEVSSIFNAYRALLKACLCIIFVSFISLSWTCNQLIFPLGIYLKVTWSDLRILFLFFETALGIVWNK
jgi:hypothetical protein